MAKGKGKKVRILTGNTTVGRPPYKRNTTRGADSGIKVDPTKANGNLGGVTRLIRKNPADGVTANIGTNKDIPILGAITDAVFATYETALAGTNNDLHFDAVLAGAAANGITVRYVVAGNNTSLTVSVASLAITVNVATNGGGTATSTANLVMAAIKASAPASALVNVSLKTGNDGTGVVTALSATHLAGGADAVTTPTHAVNITAMPTPGVVKSKNFDKGNAIPTGTLKRRAGLNVNRGIKHTKNN